MVALATNGPAPLILDAGHNTRFGFAHLQFQVRVRVFENDDGLAFLSWTVHVVGIEGRRNGLAFD